jgi:hypothetical protein
LAVVEEEQVVTVVGGEDLAPAVGAGEDFEGDGALVGRVLVVAARALGDPRLFVHTTQLEPSCNVVDEDDNDDDENNSGHYHYPPSFKGR